ncbi:MAG: hypothetical protein GX126_17570 [Bacteroidales bacterium]|nr:hypothetical protein [Bacteroidales bacterium]
MFNKGKHRENNSSGTGGTTSGDESLSFDCSPLIVPPGIIHKPEQLTQMLS